MRQLREPTPTNATCARVAARLRSALAPLSTESYTPAQSKALEPAPTRVIDAVRTCRPTGQDKIGIDLALERLTLLTDHRQLTLWSDSALKKFDSCDEGDFPELSFLQMPVVLARGIFGISIYNVSNYTPMIMHGSTSHISISLAE